MGGELRIAYDKLHLYDAFAEQESTVVRPGNTVPGLVNIDGWRFGVMTCYDLRFPELARTLATAGTDVICVSAAWVRGPLKEHHWATLAFARAIENTCYLMACSELGPTTIGCIASSTRLVRRWLERVRILVSSKLT